MKTLLFCTSHIASEDEWRQRYQRWISHHAALPFACDATFLIDDASPYVPQGSVTLLDDRLPDSLQHRGVYLYRFREHLGRRSVTDFPGWLRSFLWSFEIAARFGFEKVVHVESDAYLLSGRLASYLEGLRTGWTALWCPKWEFAETAIQVVCLDRFWAIDWPGARHEQLRGNAPELFLPFTHVEKGFVGDRYGEYAEAIPDDADYAVQVAPAMAVRFGENDAHRLRRTV
jgi:hypothetical protein